MLRREEPCGHSRSAVASRSTAPCALPMACWKCAGWVGSHGVGEEMAMVQLPLLAPPLTLLPSVVENHQGNTMHMTGITLTAIFGAIEFKFAWPAFPLS